MYPRENEDVLEAMREGLEQGAALRRAVAEGRIGEDTAVAAICAPPQQEGRVQGRFRRWAEDAGRAGVKQCCLER